MTEIRSVCVYCGSRSGDVPDLEAAAASLGRTLARSGIRLVFGGGSLGLMGVAARAAQALGGETVGVIPHHLDRVEVTMMGLSQLYVVDSMHARKHRMFVESDAFAVLPGGIGTLDEFIEILTWRHLGLHNKPVALLNYRGYWDPLLGLFQHMVSRDFAAREIHDLYTVVTSVEELLPTLKRDTGGPAAERSDLI